MDLLKFKYTHIIYRDNQININIQIFKYKPYKISNKYINMKI